MGKLTDEDKKWLVANCGSAAVVGLYVMVFFTLLNSCEAQMACEEISEALKSIQIEGKQ